MCRSFFCNNLNCPLTFNVFSFYKICNYLHRDSRNRSLVQILPFSLLELNRDLTAGLSGMLQAAFVWRFLVFSRGSRPVTQINTYCDKHANTFEFEHWWDICFDQGHLDTRAAGAGLHTIDLSATVDDHSSPKPQLRHKEIGNMQHIRITHFNCICLTSQ